ncbi:hypothetical protein ACLOJK_005261 [Asimina triloba]
MCVLLKKHGYSVPGQLRHDTSYQSKLCRLLLEHAIANGDIKSRQAALRVCLGGRDVAAASTGGGICNFRELFSMTVELTLTNERGAKGDPFLPFSLTHSNRLDCQVPTVDPHQILLNYFGKSISEGRLQLPIYHWREWRQS